MSILAASLSLALVAQPAPDIREFASKVHGLQWSVPRAWRMTTRRDVVTYEIPTSAGPARVEIYATNYRRSTDEWQTIQKTVNEDLKRTVDRQWSEELLGVPMMLTRVTYGQRGLLIGILYTATPGKFHFRLDAPAAGFGEAEASWRRVLNSLRPLGGKLPSADDGVRPLEAPAAPQPTAVTFTTEDVKPVVQRNVVNLVVANREVTLRLPDGWTLDAAGILNHKDLAEGAKIEFFSTIDSPDPGSSLLEWVNGDLANFTLVDQRLNTGPRVNKAKISVFTTVRWGKDAKGERQAFAGVAQGGQFYFFVKRITTGPEKAFQADRRLLEQFFDRVSIGPRA